MVTTVDSGASSRTRYAMYGALVGAAITVMATLIHIANAGDDLNLQTARLAQRNPLMWILDLMPAVFTAVGLVLGTMRDRLSMAEATSLAINNDLRVATRALEESAIVVHQRQIDLDHAQDDLDRFARVAAHDLRAPLLAIHSLAAWLREDLNQHLTPEGHEHLNLLQKRAQRMADLLNSLQAYTLAGRETDHVEPVDVKLLAHQALQRIPNGNRFIMTFDGDDQALHTSRSALSTVLYVLLDNCVRHHDRAPGRIFVSTRDLSTHVEMVVTDDGPGIAAADHDRVFRLFVTLAEREDGDIGAGLAVARRVVLAMGGNIRLLDEDGRGTRVAFTWPKERTAESHSAEALARLSLKTLAVKPDGPPSSR